MSHSFGSESASEHMSELSLFLRLGWVCNMDGVVMICSRHQAFASSIPYSLYRVPEQLILLPTM